jgi:hypothetical protein
MPYAVANDAADLAGLTAGDVTAAHATLADNLVDSLMNRVPDGFAQNTATSEPHDIPIFGTRELLLDHHPVISITTVVVDARASNPTTLDSGNYIEEHGILKLVTPAEVNAGIEWVSSWPRGIAMVEVTYEYGYAAVPALIVQLANIIAGGLGKQAVQDANRPASGATSIRIGDFEEKYSKDPTSAVVDMLDNAGKIILNQCISNGYKEYRF